MDATSLDAPAAELDRQRDAPCPQCGRVPTPLRLTWRQRAYWKVFLIGFALYLATMKLLAASGNPNFVPTVIALGAFLVPVTYVVFLYENGALFDIPPSIIALTFFFGGVLGTISAQLLEQQLVSGPGLGGMLAVGFSEEVAKLLAIAWLLGRNQYRSMLHGIIFGAAAGMGFAAFETMGYGFTYLLASKGNLDVLGEVLLTRGLLAPLGHGTWGAIVAGVIWRERGARWPRPTWPVARAFVGVVVLHALWDWTASAIPIQIGLPGFMLHWRFVDFMLPGLDLSVPGLVVGGIGLWVLIRMLRKANRQHADALAAHHSEHQAFEAI